MVDISLHSVTNDRLFDDVFNVTDKLRKLSIKTKMMNTSSVIPSRDKTGYLKFKRAENATHEISPLKIWCGES